MRRPRSGSTGTGALENSARSTARPQMVGISNHLRAPDGRVDDQSPYGAPPPRGARPQPSPVHRPRWREQPQATADRRQTARAHDPHRREEGRTHPRRRRLAHPRQEQRPRPTGCAPQRQVGARRLRLPALRHRRVLPASPTPRPWKASADHALHATPQRESRAPQPGSPPRSSSTPVPGSPRTNAEKPLACGTSTTTTTGHTAPPTENHQRHCCRPA